MNRTITTPSYYNGSATAAVALITAEQWDFTTDRDIKVTNELTSASSELDMSFTVSTTNTLSAGYAYAFMNKFTELRSNQENICWHYDISVDMEYSAVPCIMVPFVSQNEDADADMARWQVLQHTSGHSETAGMVASLRARGEVVRRKQAVVGAEDTNGLIFGVLIWNTSGSGGNFQGIGHMSIHPNNYPLVCDQATV